MVNEIVFLIARIISGLIFIMFGLNHFQMLEGMSGYAKMKNVPLPKLSVILSGVVLLVGGISILLGIYPIFGLLGLTIFFLIVTPKMHDFWNVEDEQQKQSEKTNFLKNVALLGLILALLAFTLDSTWPLAIIQS